MVCAPFCGTAGRWLLLHHNFGVCRCALFCIMFFRKKLLAMASNLQINEDLHCNIFLQFFSETCIQGCAAAPCLVSGCALALLALRSIQRLPVSKTESIDFSNSLPKHATNPKMHHPRLFRALLHPCGAVASALHAVWDPGKEPSLRFASERQPSCLCQQGLE